VIAFIRWIDQAGDHVFRTYFINNRGDEAFVTTWSYLDMTALGRQEEWEDHARVRSNENPLWSLLTDVTHAACATPGRWSVLAVCVMRGLSLGRDVRTWGKIWFRHISNRQHRQHVHPQRWPTGLLGTSVWADIDWSRRRSPEVLAAHGLVRGTCRSQRPCGDGSHQ
jgi:Bacterial protein of unknown function (DUF899)